MTLVTVTTKQIKEARQAALLRYADGLDKPDRAGWLGGKCPVSEYYGIINELGSANYLGIPTEDLCLYSSNPADYTKPDAGIWEFKAGNKWTISDVHKGVRYILWAQPVMLEETFPCLYNSCPKDYHHKFSGQVEIRGWSNVKDSDQYRRMGNVYFPKAINELSTIPWGVKA